MLRFLLVAALIVIPASGFQYSQDVIGVGTIDSASDVGSFGDRARGTGELVLGVQFTNSSSMFSGFRFDGSGGAYRSWGDVGVMHSVSFRDLQRADLVTTYRTESEPLIGTVDEPVGVAVRGQSSLDLNFTGRMKESVTGLGPYGRPLDLSRTELNGTFELDSKVVV